MEISKKKTDKSGRRIVESDGNELLELVYQPIYSPENENYRISLFDFLCKYITEGDSVIETKIEKMNDGKIALILNFLYYGHDSWLKIWELVDEKKADILQIKEYQWEA